MIAGLAMLRQKVPKPTIICMFSTLQDLQHTVRTAYGESKLTYRGPLWTTPLQGIGKGNGVGPSIWDVVSSPSP